MANKNNSQILMNDQQYYNGGYTKPGTLNKSTIAAMSRENLTQGQQRRMEPKHLQQPRPRSAVQYRTEQPDLIKGYDQTNGLPNGLHPSYQPDDQLRRSQGTNTKHQREFQIQNQNSPQMNGRSHGNNPVIRTDRPDQSPVLQNRELVMHKQKSVNGFNHESQTVVHGEKRPRPRSRGVSANSSAIELINMNYNSIQSQLERSLRPPSRMKGEEGSPTTKDVEQSLNSSTGRKTPHDFSQTLPVDDANRNPGRMSQAEIIRNRNMAATRQTTVDAPHLRKSRNEESGPGYQHFTQDKVSPIVPIPKKRHEDPPRSSSDRNPEPNAPIPRARIPPHEKNTRISKDGVDQLRKPRTDADIVIRRNPPPHLSTRKEPMGAESVPVQRPATSMGFVRSTANKQNKDQEQQLNVRQKLELLQRRKSGGANLETNYKDFVANTESSPSRPESRGQRPPSGVKENRRRSYTTSTPAKSEDRLHPKATEKIRQADGRTSRTSSDSSSSKDQSRSSRTNIVAPVSRVPPSGPSGPAFGDRSTHRWKEIEQLSSTSPQEQRRNGRRSSRGDYPFFLDFSKSTPEISNSLDSLNLEVSDHLSSNDRPKVNGQSGNTLSAIPNDLKLTMEDLDVQGTPQLSSPVDFNPDGSSNEDLDLEVRTLLGQTENGVDTLDMALYQKLINGSVHKKICSLRDRSFVLDKKDNDLKSKRERLQRRMQQTLAKTTAMLNKSVELERSRVQVDLDVMDQSKAEELAVIQSLSSTVRPKTPSGSSGHSTRPQHVSDSFHNHSTIVKSDSFDTYTSLDSDTCITHYTDSCTTASRSLSDSCTTTSRSLSDSCTSSRSLNDSCTTASRSQCDTLPSHTDPAMPCLKEASEFLSHSPRASKSKASISKCTSEENEASLSFTFDSVNSNVLKVDTSRIGTMSCVLMSGSPFLRNDSKQSCPEFYSLDESDSAKSVSQELSEENETSLSFSFHSIIDGDETEPNLSQCEPSASISEYSQAHTPQNREFSYTMQESPESFCVTPDLSIIEHCPSQTPKTFVYPMAKRLLFGKSRCSTDFSFSPYRPPNVTSGNMTSDQLNMTSDQLNMTSDHPNMTSDQLNTTQEWNHPPTRLTKFQVTAGKRKNMFSSTPVPEKQRRLSSASVHNSNFKRFCRLRRVVNAKHVRRLSLSRESAPTKRKGSFYSPVAKKSKTNLNENSAKDSTTFRRYCAARRITVRKVRRTGALKIRSIPTPKDSEQF